MVLQIVLLVLATVVTLTFVINPGKGKKYVSYVEGLDEKEYFLKDIYVVGFALNETKLFRLRGKLEHDLKKSSKLVWDNKYYVYYAYLAWAQFLSLALLVLALGLSFAALMGGESSLMIIGIAILESVYVQDERGCGEETG